MGRIDILREFNNECNDIVDTAMSIANKYTNLLDICIFDLKHLLENAPDLSDEKLNHYIAYIPVLIYDLTDRMQILAVRTDAAKMQRKTQFNQVYVQQSGTIADRSSEAQLQSVDEQFIEDIYTEVYKCCQNKIEAANSLHASLKKIQSWRLAEMDVTKNNMLANGRE